ncbi:MAG TPA: hypothetical protein VN654_09165 [Vicinamibacterales bacterium]|nr:hypothetical protein [Vicinamibacterales bacterium]
MSDDRKKHWPIARTWVIRAKNTERETVTTDSLGAVPVCFLLGSAGLGKTYETGRLAHIDRAEGRVPIVVRLAELAQSPTELTTRLDALSKHLTASSVVYLDALDEIMLPVPSAAVVVGRWIRESVLPTGARLRISCRSAVWPAFLQTELQHAYPDAVTAILQPLSLNDVEIAASSQGLDAKAFVRAVVDVHAESLAEQPLTLEVLLRIHRDQGALPNRRTDLFGRGIEILAREREDRIEAGTPPADVPQLIDAAERLACFALLTGLETMAVEEHSGTLSTSQLANLPRGGVDESRVRALRRSALIDSSELRQFRFAHRQFAEFLAGRRIASLLLHQAKALLASGLGWRSGVPGPLRETAAFAAMHNESIGGWLAECDPEVIGVSDVADDELRRRAALNLVDLFRRHALTASQIWRTDLDVSGFRYPGAEHDLRPVLRERGAGAEDVLECALKFIRDWQLTTMSDDLADLALDPTAPIHARVSAGYALAEFGTDASRVRLKPLIVRGPDDPAGELKGLALRSNWPAHLTTAELFNALTPPPKRFYIGAYSSFIAVIDRSDFSAHGHVPEGLDWLRRYFDDVGGLEGVERVAARITRAAVQELNDAAVAERLAALLVAIAAKHSDSPLGSERHQRSAHGGDSDSIPWTAERRRALIDALVETGSGTEVWWVAHDTRGLLVSADFRWLLQRATDGILPLEQRTLYADVARMVPWEDSSDNIDAWLKVRTLEPIASKIPGALIVDLGSSEAQEARKGHRRIRERPRKTRRRRVKPPPEERIQAVLDRAERDDPAFFFALARELTLEEFSTHYGSERFITRTPGWAAADTVTRQRVLDAAKRVLTASTDDPEKVRSEPLNTIKGGHALAVWLLLDQDPAWLDTLGDAWWNRWAWYLVRELHPHLHGEPDEPKRDLLAVLFRHAPSGVRAAVVELATGSAEGAETALTSLLDLLESMPDSELDGGLIDAVSTHRVPEDRISRVAEFVLRRTGEAGLSTFATLLHSDAPGESDAVLIRSAAALITHVTRDGWNHAQRFLRSRPDLAPQVLGQVFYRERFLSTQAGQDAGPASMAPEQLGELLCLLLEAFPPENDPKRDGAHFVTPDDASRTARSQIVSWLSERHTAQAIATLRYVEQRLGERYPWLRSARVTAERRFRLAQWRPFEPKTIGETLDARQKHLIRSDADALDAVVEAVEIYARRLRQDSLGDLDDFWNLPKRGRPTPKDEQRASEKVGSAIRDYLRDYAVTADREVQIFRRLTPADAGGAPGSKPDVLCRVPAAATVTDVPIAIPLEVKLSFNPQARSGFQDQLAGRYIPQVAATGGVYVLVWIKAPRLSTTYRPLWPTLAAAQQDLTRLADDENAKLGSTAEVRVTFIDASLPTVDQAKRLTRGKLTTKKASAKRAFSQKRKRQTSTARRKAQPRRPGAKRQKAKNSGAAKPKPMKRVRPPKVRR